MGPDDEAGFPGDPSRARRAKALGAVSVLVVAIASVAYLRPAIQHSPIPLRTGPVGYRLDAVDFVDPATGWVIADLDSSQFAVAGTKDAGRTWTTRLVSPTTGHGEYMRFFDQSSGVVVAIGGGAAVFETRDGGAHWAKHEVDPGGYVIAASFVDLAHGWVLVYGAAPDGLGSADLWRTVNGGVTWKNLGRPAPPSAEAFSMSFTDAGAGWLDAVASGPYAYTTSDAGVTWRQVTLPEPATGWPLPHGSFFVAARPTLGNGVVVTVVNSAHINGRSAAGTAVLAYPPLTVRTFDGGSPVVYVYSTFVDSSSILRVFDSYHKPGPATQAQPASQIGLSSTDGGLTWSSFEPPGAGGTIGYADAVTWWWVGPGVSSTTTDGGQTWTQSRADSVADPQPGSLVVLDSKHAWVSGTADGGPLLFTTSDGGDRWTSVRLPQAFT